MNPYLPINPVVTTYAELLAAPIGSIYHQFPYVYEKADWGVCRHAPDTSFTPP